MLTKHETLSFNIYNVVSCHSRLPKIVYSTENPLIGEEKENVTLF